jgi:uncharacterized glyoxalase superfamily protein PhnB
MTKVLNLYGFCYFVVTVKSDKTYYSKCSCAGTKEEADLLFAALSKGGQVQMPMAYQTWGDYYGDFQDQFCIRWMINYHKEG